MQIAANQTIAGYPALEVRNFVRKHQLTPITEEAAEITLKLNHRAAADFLRKFVDIGLIEKHSEQEGTPLYALTQDGEALAQVSSAKPIHRKTAERILEQFLERVHKANATTEYLYRVEDVILFGSMLSNVERLGDVDVAINLEPKVSDCDARREWSRRRRRVAIEAGRSLGTFRRVLFNILIHNTDDHLRNHGFFIDEQGIRLSPAYDMNPSIDRTELTLAINEVETACDIAIAMDACRDYGLTTQQADSRFKRQSIAGAVKPTDCISHVRSNNMMASAFEA